MLLQQKIEIEARSKNATLCNLSTVSKQLWTQCLIILGLSLIRLCSYQPIESEVYTRKYYFVLTFMAFGLNATRALKCLQIYHTLLFPDRFAMRRRTRWDLWMKSWKPHWKERKKNLKRQKKTFKLMQILWRSNWRMNHMPEQFFRYVFYSLAKIVAKSVTGSGYAYVKQWF